MEDAARWEPQAGVENVDSLAEAGSMLQLVDEEEGYDPTDCF